MKVRIDYLLLFVLSFHYASLCYGQAENNEKILKGRIEKFQFKESKIFPGTVREVEVYIPEQIEPLTPACVYVQQDGLPNSFNDVLDTLIADKEIPITVGVFIHPGTLPPINSNTLGRPNRGFEYDGLGDNYARFILEEILPCKRNQGTKCFSQAKWRALCFKCPTDNQTGKVWLVKNGSKVIVDQRLNFPTGLAMSPDRWLLAVADKKSHSIYSYHITMDDALTNKERYFWLHVPDRYDNSGTESVCYDREGHLYAATNYGVQVCTWDGPTQVILPLPDNTKVTGICIGGASFDTLFAFCGDKVYKRKIKNHTVGAFTPWMKMVPGQL